MSANARASQTQQTSPAHLPPPMMNRSDGSPPIHFGFFGGHDMDVNMHPRWEGSTLQEVFRPRYQGDQATMPEERDVHRHVASSAAEAPAISATAGQPGGKKSTQPVSDDVISISSYEDDGAKPCHIPGDSTYRGRTPRTRIKDGQRAGFSRVTRSQGRKAAKAKPGSNRAGTEENNDANDVPTIVEGKNTRRSRRNVKSKAIVMSSDDADDAEEPSKRTPMEPPFTQPRPPLDPSPLPAPESSQQSRRKGKAVAKRSRNSRNESGSDNPRPTKRSVGDDSVEISDSSDFPEGFTASELGKLVKGAKKSKESRQKLLKKINGLFRSSKRWRDTFLDLEAEEDDGGSNSSAHGCDEDEGYDYSDSFIDDSELREDEEMADPDTPFPGLELDDFVRQANSERAAQIEEDRCIARAITRHTAMVQSALDVAGNRGLHPDVTDNSPPCNNESNQGATTQQGASESVASDSKSSEDREPSSSEDEFGVKFYRVQFREAIQRSRRAHERRLAEERNAREGRRSQVQHQLMTPSGHVAFSRPSPSYDSINTTPPPPYTPGPGGQTATPPDSSNAAPQAFPLAPGTPSASPAGAVSNGPGAVTGGQPRRLRFSWPDRCEVTDPKLHDELLATDYASLVPLRRGAFIPWSNAPGRGLIRFSAWRDHTPAMDQGKAYQALRMQRCQEFINPSRGSPADVEVREIVGGQHSHSFRLHAYLNGQPAICVTAIFSEISCLRTLTTFGLPQNMLQGKLHTQEFDRLVGFFCMTFGIRELHANLSRDSMHFVTRPVSRDGFSSPAQAAGMFSNSPSPSTKRPGANRLLADHFALDSKNDVPIYDARGSADFDFGTDLPSMASKLPTLSTGEIPYGSFVVVGYTASVYKANNGNWTLSCNIRWAIVVGSPPDNVEQS